MADSVFPHQIRELLDRLEVLCEEARRLREQINDALKRERSVHRTVKESEPPKTPAAK